MEGGSPPDQPREQQTGSGPAEHPHQDEGTSTGAGQGPEDAGYIGSYTAPDAQGQAGTGAAEQPAEASTASEQPLSEQQGQQQTEQPASATAARSADGATDHQQQAEGAGRPDSEQPQAQGTRAGSAGSARSGNSQQQASGSARASATAETTQGPPEQQQQQQQQQQPASRGASAKSEQRQSSQQVTAQEQPTPSRGGSAKGEQQQQSSQQGAGAQEQRPMSREGAGTAYAAQAEAAARSKAQAAEASGYVAPGLRLIDVEVTQGPGLPNRLLRVLMDYTQADNKPYLGGNRNKVTSTVFHHAVTQTPKAPRYLGAEPKLERTTQTVKVKHHTAQTNREAATQMERPGLLLDVSNDVERVPGRYQTSEEWMEIVDRAVRTIQRWNRGWVGRKRAAYLLKNKMQREAFLREEEAKAQSAADKHRQTEIERRMHPRTAADFEILYNELEAWRLQETYKIMNAGLPKDKEQLMLQQLLHKETKLLQTIDRLKINANHENKDLRIQRTLGDMSKPKTYELRNGTKVEVHTPFTTRAKELMQLYNGLNLPMLTIDERLDVLLHVKWTVKEFDCNLTREIVELVDREADLLNRGRSPMMLEGLRKRISTLFLSFVETPEFNPVSSQFQVVPMDFEQYMFEKLEKSTAKTPSSTKSHLATITCWE